MCVSECWCLSRWCVFVCDRRAAPLAGPQLHLLDDHRIFRPVGQGHRVGEQRLLPWPGARRPEQQVTAGQRHPHQERQPGIRVRVGRDQQLRHGYRVCPASRGVTSSPPRRLAGQLARHTSSQIRIGAGRTADGTGWMPGIGLYGHHCGGMMLLPVTPVSRAMICAGMFTIW